MASRSAVNISLTPSLRAFVSKQMRTGRYQSTSEVVREGLRLLQDRETQRAAAVDEIRRKIAEGLAQARRGELRDTEEFFDELEREHARSPKLRRRSA